MRVLVATDGIGTLRSAHAGAVIAQAWADAVAGTQVAVVPVGESGEGFLSALADQVGADLQVAGIETTLSLGVVAGPVVAVGLTPAVETEEVDLAASSYVLGVAVRDALAAASTPPETLVVDLGGLASHDGGAGLLAALGATADVPLTAGATGLARLSRLDLTAVRNLLGPTALVGIVPHDEVNRVLLGLRGITARLRTPGTDPALLLSTDADLTTLARLTGPKGLACAGRPGAGAAGGAGFAVLALGGRLATGTGYLGDQVGFAGTLARSDLLVTGCTVFDFATRGGGVLAQLARRAETALRPCIAIAGEVLIGGREMRTMGIEAAYPVWASTLEQPDPVAVTGSELAEAAQRVARTWSW